MFTIRIDRTLTQFAAASLLLALAAGSASAASYLKYDGVDGESHVGELSGLEISPFGNEPVAALLLPAVQKVREAAASAPNMAALVCSGEVLPELVIEVTKGNGKEPYLRYKLKDVIVSSFEMRGGAADDVLIGGRGTDAPGAGLSMSETATITYTGLEFTNLETGRTMAFDCSSGRCVCVASP